MKDKNIETQTQQAISSPLVRRPQRQSGKSARRLLTYLLLTLSGLMIVGGGIVLAMLLLPHSISSNGNGGSPAVKKSGGLPAGCTGARIPLDTVQQETAAGLHLTVAQVKNQVLAGKTISQIATAQGVSAAQLRTIEIHALQTANARWLSMGCITRQDVTSNMQRDTGTAAYMDEEFTDLFKQP